jgi:ferredoxin
MKMQALYFSPTGGTKKIVEEITKGSNMPQAEPIDLTLPNQREAWDGSVKGDILIVGAPVYASTFPAVLLPSLKMLKGKGRLAVPVAVYGNAKMGAAVGDLAGVLHEQGFTIPAAANFVAQHSFITEKCTIGKGRPDDLDLIKARRFGEDVAIKIKTDREDIVSTNQVPPDTIYIRSYVRGMYYAKGMYLPSQYYDTVKVSINEENRDKCVGCGKCVEVCSTGAMGANLKIDNATCSRCFACVYACPSGVLGKHVDHSSDLIKWFTLQAKYRSEPTLYF